MNALLTFVKLISTCLVLVFLLHKLKLLLSEAQSVFLRGYFLYRYLWAILEKVPHLYEISLDGVNENEGKSGAGVSTVDFKSSQRTIFHVSAFCALFQIGNNPSSFFTP